MSKQRAPNERIRRWSGALAVLAVLAAGACAAGGDDDDTDVDAADVRDVPDQPETPSDVPDAPEVPDVPDAPDGDTTGPGPMLTAVSPPSGPIAGGTLVTLTGENLVAGATATFGGEPCAEPHVSSARRMTCRTPAHDAGAVDATVVNPDEQSATLAAAFTYDASGPRVNWCALHYPSELSVAPDAPAGPAYGRVYVQDVTPGDGQGPGVRAQIGVGPAGSDPGGWAWGDAAYNISVDGIVPGDVANDEYQATIVGRPEGEYSYAFRFSVDDGETWLLCDRTGSDDGFNVAHAGTLHVVPVPPPTIGWCRLDRPTTVGVELGSATETIYGRVFVPGVTNGDGQGSGVLGEVGVGRPGTDPAAGTWSWTAMTYADSVDGILAGDLANDEYGAPVDAPAEAGSYLHTVRFSVDGGTLWTLCDTTGAGYAELNAGRLTATDPGTGPLVGWCNLQWPSTLTVAAGVTTDPIYGRVWAEGVTTAVGQGAGITGQVGFGDAAADPATWTWIDAPYNTDVDGLSAGDHANDEYWQPLTLATAGTYAFAYRFSMDSGRSWRYCDLDGTTVGEFTPDQAGRLTVE